MKHSYKVLLALLFIILSGDLLAQEFESETPEFKNPGGKTIYFKPTCEFQRPLGGIGGDFFGILSEQPVLVE